MSNFIFQSVPKRFDLRSGLHPGKPDRWDATLYVTLMQPGDIVFFWMGGDPSIRGLYGWGEISSPVVNRGVGVTYKVKFSKVILATELRKIDSLSRMLIFRVARGTNFLLTEDEARALAEKIKESGEQAPAFEQRDNPPPPTPTESSPPAASPLPEPPESTPFYSDHPAQRDLLNRKAVAETIATMIESVWREDDREKLTDRSFIVHLHGRWGSGKTSILNFLSEALLGTRTGGRPRPNRIIPRG